MAKIKKTRAEYQADAKELAELEATTHGDKFVSKPGEMVLVEEGDPSKLTLWDQYGNAVDAEGNLIPDPPLDDPPPS